MLLVEQPEIHLHPGAQATLGDLLLAIAEKGNRKLIVETHSEHLLSRIQTRIAEGVVSADDVALYYFEPTPEGTAVQRIPIDGLGKLKEPIPKGFFDERYQETIAHFRAVSKKSEEAETRS